MSSDSSEILKNKSESFKNVVIAVAVIIGGGWTLFTFWALEAANRAKAELDELNTRIFREPVLKIDFDLKQDKLEKDTHKYISGNVSIENIGKKNALLKFRNESPPFTATEVTFDNSGQLKLGRQYAQYPPKYAGYSVRVADTEKIPFFLQVGKPGLYFVDFEVSVTEHNLEDNIGAENEMSWTASTYIAINE